MRPPHLFDTVQTSVGTTETDRSGMPNQRTHRNRLLEQLPPDDYAQLAPHLKLVMTQELIANMLGVRSECVTEAAGDLQGVTPS